MKLKINFKEQNFKINAKLHQSAVKINAKIGELVHINTEAKVYRGSYEFIPTVDGGELATAQKLMERNVVIKPIPTYEVSNQAGGNTFYIATVESNTTARLGKAILGQMRLGKD